MRSNLPRWFAVLLLLVAWLAIMPAHGQQAREASQRSKGFTERIARIDGVKINYKIAGQGPVVVLLHGYTQTSHNVDAADPEARHVTYRDCP
jgi:hypothetical protein